MDVSFAFCIFVRPVLSVTNEGKEGFRQRLIERQARGGNGQSSGSRRQCGNCAEVGLNKALEIEALERNREKRKGGTPAAE